MFYFFKHSVISDIMGKAADLSDFEEGQIIRAWRLGISVSEMAHLVGCSCTILVNSYRKWCMDDETTSHQPALCRPQCIDSRGDWRLLRIVCHDRRDTVAKITTSYKSGNLDSFFQHTTLLHTGLCSQRLKHAPALMAHHRQLHLQGGITNVHCDHVASHVGIAQGICNILRGIPYNVSKGRVFLPLELMSKHRLSQEGLLHGDQKKNLQDAVYDLSCVAHQHLQMGRKLHKDVPGELKPVFLPAGLHNHITNDVTLVDCGRLAHVLDKMDY
ncbi:hypothetical protein X975_10264, partial [Stegodyphus mimosarum]